MARTVLNIGIMRMGAVHRPGNVRMGVGFTGRSAGVVARNGNLETAIVLGLLIGIVPPAFLVWSHQSHAAALQQALGTIEEQYPAEVRAWGGRSVLRDAGA